MNRLRVESEAAQDDARKGLLLHELGVAEDAARAEGQAAKDLLTAVNTLPDLHESLERLLSIIDRRRSYKNLGKLLDRLVKIAGTPEETARALVAHAEFKEDHEGDVDGARDALERATQTKGDDVAAWLTLERLAARTGDASIRARALAARADLAKDPEWRALLSIDVAKLHADAGDLDAALGSLERALAARSRATLAALTELERLALTAGKLGVAADALEKRAELVRRATEDPSDAEASSVPADERSPAHVAEALLRAAELRRQEGNAVRAVELLDRVLAALPGDPVATAARLRAAEASGDTETAATLARAELAQGVRGAAAAAFWMRVTEAAASSGDAEAALSALASALAEDPACIHARTLQLDLLSNDPPALAKALESAAADMGEDALSAQLFLLAADTWARGVGDAGAAKAALSQAAAAGTSPEVAARVGRALAALRGDDQWLEESTRRLLALDVEDEERVGLGFELVRGRLLRGDPSAADALAMLRSAEGGAWLGAVLGAYARSADEPADARALRGGAALEALADLATDDVERGRAFRLAAALRFVLAGRLEAAVEDVRRVHAEDPSDLVATTALATLLRRSGAPLEAAETLATWARDHADGVIAPALRLEAAIIRWLSGDRPGSLADLESAAAEAPESGAALLSWALRAAQPDDVGARRKALDAAAELEDPEALAVERFALEAGSGGDAASAVAALVAPSTEDTVAVALDLAAALSTGAPADRRAAAAEVLAARAPEAAAIVRGAAYLDALEGGASAAEREAAAARWADVDASAAAATEWVAQAVAAKDVAREATARARLAAALPASLGTAVAASARIVARIGAGDVEAPLLPGADEETRLTNLELSPPSCDPRRRAAALLACAEGLDEPSRPAALALAGWNLLAVGDTAHAIDAFQRYVATHEEDIVGWEGLRAAAELAQDRPLLAQASAALGDLVGDPGQGSELWERAAAILLDDLGDAARGEAALSRAVERDIGRHSAFDRLFRMVRARRDSERVLELAAARLAVAEDPEEIAKLYWERARALREKGDARGALESLESVTMLEPDHVGALALTGEIFITEKRFEEAAGSLARLASLPAAPVQQRLMSGVAAVDLYENRLQDVPRALEVLVGLHQAGLATPPVRERLARAAAKAEAWDTATTVLEELMEQREEREGRIAAARLAMAIRRDRLGDPAGAQRAVERLLAEAPDDGEALDLVLGGVLPAAATAALLDRGRAATLESLIREPLDLDRTTRLAEIARTLGDVQLRQVALGAVVALGGGTPEALMELSALDGRIARTPQIAIDDSVVASVRDPEDRGPIAELFRQLAPTLAEALGPGLAALGVSRKERINPKDGLPLRNEIAAWAGALGIGEFELYLGGRDPDGICAVATETPAIVVGGSVAHPLSAAHRAVLARELLGLKLGTTILRHRDPTEIAALVAAACNIAGVRLDAPAYAMLAEFERQLGKELPRRLRKVLPELTSPIAAGRADPGAWVRAARASLDRMSAIAVGDVSRVLATAGGGNRGDAPSTGEAQLRAARLLSFALSPAYFAVRERLGMGIR